MTTAETGPDAQDQRFESRGREWIGRLFQMVEQFEAASATFDREAFTELYERVERLIERAGEARTGTAENSLDRALFDQVSVADFESSDLRYVVSHVLSIHLEHFANQGRGFNQAHRWAKKSLPPQAQNYPDLSFLTTFVLPRLTTAGALGGAYDLGLFLIERIARFHNLQERTVGLEDEEVDRLLSLEPMEMIYELARRKMFFVGEFLPDSPGRLEQQVQARGQFRQLAARYETSEPLLAYQLGEGAYDYFNRATLWERFRQWFGALWRRLGERMIPDYWLHWLTKKKGAYIVQLLMIVFFLAVGGMVGFVLAQWSQKELESIDRDLDQATGRIEDKRVDFRDGVTKTEELRELTRKQRVMNPEVEN